MHQPRPRRRSRRAGSDQQPGHQHHLHPRPRDAVHRPARAGAPGRLLRPRAPARRLHQPRPCGTTSPPSSGKCQDMTSGQISYDLRRLRAHQIIERIPHSRAYQVTEDGLTIALFLTRVAQRLLIPVIPGLAELTSPGPPGRSRAPASRPRLPRRPDRPRPAGIPRRLTPPAAITLSNHEPVISRHTRLNLTRNSKSLRGKITYGYAVIDGVGGHAGLSMIALGEGNGAMPQLPLAQLRVIAGQLIIRTGHSFSRLNCVRMLCWHPRREW